MEQLTIVFEDEDVTPEVRPEPHMIEVCDLPYYTEPMPFYDLRMEMKIRVGKVREKACELFEKENGSLTVHDLKFAFLKMCPLPVNLGGDNHKVTVKKLGGKWILSCDCPSWIFNLSGRRICRHTNYVENMMRG